MSKTIDKVIPISSSQDFKIVEESSSRMDVRTFFRDVERGTHNFLSFWTKNAEQNQRLHPYRMTKDAWWREFLKWAEKNETY